MKIKSLIPVLIFHASTCFSADFCKDVSDKPFDYEDFNFDSPVKIQTFLTQQLFDPRAKDIVETCSADADYLEAMDGMEFAVTQAAIHSPEVNQAIRKLNLTLLEWFKEAARLKADLRRTSFESELNALLIQYYGNCTNQFPGCVGSDPKDILEAFHEGNLRESFFLSWNAAVDFIDDFYSCKKQTTYCVCNSRSYLLNRINNEKDPSQKSNLEKIADFCKDPVDQSHKQHPYRRGRFARANKEFRKELETMRPVPAIAAISTEMIPLSKREMKVDGASHLNWDRGDMIFKPIRETKLDRNKEGFPDPHNLYHSTRRNFGFRGLVAMSGSLDQILSLGCILGIQSRADRQNILLSATGYMVPHGHHSVYEILVSGKAFGLHPNLNSEYYKSLSDDPKFAKNVEDFYKNATQLPLPTEVYYQCLERKFTVEEAPACGQSDPAFEMKNLMRQVEKVSEEIK